jgi:hypothetical protein
LDIQRAGDKIEEKNTALCILFKSRTNEYVSGFYQLHISKDIELFDEKTPFYPIINNNEEITQKLLRGYDDGDERCICFIPA